MKQGTPVMGLSMKIVYVAVAIVCLLLGILGLIMPVLPGVLFLAIALLLLSRVSHRLRRWSQHHPELRTLRRRMACMSAIRAGDRIKLAGWMGLEMLVRGVGRVFEVGKSLIPATKRQA